MLVHRRRHGGQLFSEPMLRPIHHRHRPTIVEDHPRQQADQNRVSGYHRAIATWMGSVVGHALLLCLLALIAVVPALPDGRLLIRVRTVDQEPWLPELDVIVEPVQPEDEVADELIEVARPQQDIQLVPLDPPTVLAQTLVWPGSKELSPLVDTNVPLAKSQSTTGEGVPITLTAASSEPGEVSQEQIAEEKLGGRNLRRIIFAAPNQNYAIHRGLDWLARHQQDDRGWAFEHRRGECRGRCPNPGTQFGARNAATGLALLAFLGAGQSPEQGEYRTVVASGINYLMENTSRHGSLWQQQGEMYGQGIATLALCECYGILTQTPPNPQYDTWQPVDRERLRNTATAAIQFIVAAQAVDGGWRYAPGELGDTSVVGWQIMALKSAADAGLGERPKTMEAAARFLDSVQMDSVGDLEYGMVGTQYAYQPYRRKISDATSAIGMACRIYMGTSPFHPGIKIAVKRLADRGPIAGNMYFNVYANQIVFQHGGVQWDTWSQRLNQGLIASQSTRGHMEGSWYFGHGDHGGMAGGRLYATAMACLGLEESFRHLPIYRKNPTLQFRELLGAANATGSNAENQPFPVEPVTVDP